MFTYILLTGYSSPGGAQQMDVDPSAADGVKDTSIRKQLPKRIEKRPAFGKIYFFIQAQRAGRRGAEYANAALRPAGTAADANSLLELLLYDGHTNSATPNDSNDRKVLRLARSSSLAKRLSGDHDPSGSFAVSISRTGRRPGGRELLSAGKDLRHARSGLFRITENPAASDRSEIDRLCSVPPAHAQRLLSGLADYGHGGEFHERLFRAWDNGPCEAITYLQRSGTRGVHRDRYRHRRCHRFHDEISLPARGRRVRFFDDDRHGKLG